MRRRDLTALPILVALLAPTALYAQERGTGQPPAGRGQRPPRDAVRPVQPAGTASISGRVVSADTGRPLKRARVTASSADRPRIATTDESGRFRINGLPAGTYTITASKTGFVDGSFGQRRTRGGTPIQIADGQQLASVDVALARGAVISGRVLDEDGEPLARTMVQALRYVYQRGERRLMPAGGDQTDDRGQYRIFGLPAGDYLVSAMAGGLGPMMLRRVFLDPPPLTAGFEDQAVSTGYAPTYYPGVMTAAEASRVRVAVAQELLGIDFQLQLVPLTTVRGTTTDPRGSVALVPEEGAGPLRMQSLRTRVQPDGTFTIANVPPGRYVAVARADEADGASTFAMQPVVVAGDELHLALTPVKGSRLSGTISFESLTTAPPGFGGVRVTAQPLGAALVFPRAVRPGEADETGRFVLADVMPGQYVVHGAAPRGWTVKTVYRDGRDVTDQPLDLKPGESIDGLDIVFTDRISSLAGVVQRDGDAPAGGVSVIAFAADERFWRPQSRRIQTARSDQNGTFRINNLPPGEYLLVATEDVEQGEWFDPVFLESVRDKAVRISLAEGDQKTQTLKVS